MSYINADDPPLFTEHGTADANVPTAESRNIPDALCVVIGKDNLDNVSIGGAEHGGPPSETPGNLAKVISCLDRQLKSKTTQPESLDSPHSPHVVPDFISAPLVEVNPAGDARKSFRPPVR